VGRFEALGRVEGASGGTNAAQAILGNTVHVEEPQFYAPRMPYKAFKGGIRGFTRRKDWKRATAQQGAA
jgi:hypothetical protein